MEDSWFVVAVEPNAEPAVSTRAGQLDIATYYPTGKQTVRRGRRTIEFGVERPAMPGYVFVRGSGHFSRFRRDFDDEEAVPHCLGWLSGADGPEPVKPEVVAEIKQRAAAGEFDQTARAGRYWAPRWMKGGVRVRIVVGALTGRVGEVWRLTGQHKVAIWLQTMGALTLVECPLEWIARVR